MPPKTSPRSKSDPDLSYVLCRAVERTRFDDPWDKLLCHVIARASRDGSCTHLSLWALARAAQMTEPTLRLRLRRLRQAGVLSIVSGADRNTGLGRAHNEYRLEIPLIPEDQFDKLAKSDPKENAQDAIFAGQEKPKEKDREPQRKTRPSPKKNNGQPREKTERGIFSEPFVEPISEPSLEHSTRTRVRPTRKRGEENEDGSRPLPPQLRSVEGGKQVDSRPERSATKSEPKENGSHRTFFGQVISPDEAAYA